MSFFPWPRLPQEKHKTQNQSCHRNALYNFRHELRCRVRSTWLASDNLNIRPRRRTAHLRPYPDCLCPQAVSGPAKSGRIQTVGVLRPFPGCSPTSGQSRPRASAPTPLPRRENPMSRAPNCSCAGQPTNNSLLSFITFICHNTPHSR